jgi:hypothetical protein
LIPQEDKAAHHVLERLKPFSTENGGPLKIEHVAFKEGRGNVIITYPGTNSEKIVSFIGSHLDGIILISRRLIIFKSCSCRRCIEMEERSLQAHCGR